MVALILCGANYEKTIIKACVLIWNGALKIGALISRKLIEIIFCNTLCEENCKERAVNIINRM